MVVRLLTEVLDMLLGRVATEKGLATRMAGGYMVKRISSEEDSPLAQVSHEDLAHIGEPTAEEVDWWFVDKAIRDAEWQAEQEEEGSDSTD